MKELEAYVVSFDWRERFVFPVGGHKLSLVGDVIRHHWPFVALFCCFGFEENLDLNNTSKFIPFFYIFFNIPSSLFLFPFFRSAEELGESARQNGLRRFKQKGNKQREENQYQHKIDLECVIKHK